MNFMGYTRHPVPSVHQQKVLPREEVRFMAAQDGECPINFVVPQLGATADY